MLKIKKKRFEINFGLKFELFCFSNSGLFKSQLLWVFFFQYRGFACLCLSITQTESEKKVITVFNLYPFRNK